MVSGQSEGGSEWDAVVAVPSVRDYFPGGLWETTSKMERKLQSKCLPLSVLVQRQEINSATRGAIMLSSDHHALAAHHRFAI